MAVATASQEVRALEAQLAAMDELLSGQERVVGEPSAKLAR